jgi:hypothetical protein
MKPANLQQNGTVSGLKNVRKTAKTHFAKERNCRKQGQFVPWKSAGESGKNRVSESPEAGRGTFLPFTAPLLSHPS